MKSSTLITPKPLVNVKDETDEDIRTMAKVLVEEWVDENPYPDLRGYEVIGHQPLTIEVQYIYPFDQGEPH